MPKKSRIIESESYDAEDSELVIYLLVRNDLGMTKGKMVAQCGHAVEDLVWRCPKPIYALYKKNDHPKIALRVKDLKEMEEIMEKCQEERFLHYQVVDAGRTQLKPDTPTVLGIGPVTKGKVKKIVADLKLL